MPGDVCGTCTTITTAATAAGAGLPPPPPPRRNEIYVGAQAQAHFTWSPSSSWLSYEPGLLQVPLPAVQVLVRAQGRWSARHWQAAY